MEEKKHGETHEKKMHVHHEHSHKKQKSISRAQLWQIISAILAVALVGSIMTNGFNPGVGNVAAKLSAEEATEKAVSFLNVNVLQGATANVQAVDEQADLYKLDLEISGQAYESYVTKDGRLLFPSAIALEASAIPSQPAQAAQPAQTASYPKTDKPVVDLYIMTYCPYGLQAQTGLYPVMRLLGGDAEFNVKWVPYIMHGRIEIDENTRQYCIQKEQKEKYVDYVECFVGSKDATACGTTAGIDEDMVASCITEANEEFNIDKNFDAEDTWLSGRYPIYEVDKEAADALGVRGSPSMFINGQSYGGARTPEAYKAAVCASFNNPPSDCEGVVLSSAGAAASGSCG
jgi:protein-disulfide isomerase